MSSTESETEAEMLRGARGSDGAAAVILRPENVPVAARSTRERASIGSGLAALGQQASLRFESAIDTESRQGRPFLFVPVLLGAGAIAWFTLDSPPDGWRLAALTGVLVLVAFLARTAAAPGLARTL